MRPTAPVIYPQFTQAAGTPQAEPPSRTPKNAGANVVQIRDEASSRRAAHSSPGANNPASREPGFSEAFENASSGVQTSGASARFITPDGLLPPFERAQVEHLRAREDVVKKEIESRREQGDKNSVTFVYQAGPDGRSYAVGLATPLVLQETSTDAGGAPPSLSDRQYDAAIAAYQRRAGPGSFL